MTSQEDRHSEPAASQGFEAGGDTRGRNRIEAETVTVGVIYLIAFLLILGSRVISPAFGSLNQAMTILELASFLVVVAFGQGLVILVRGLDLSVASMITLGGVLTTMWIGADGNALLLIPLVLAVCFAAGLVSGMGVTFLGVPPFIMTLSSGIIIYSLCLGYTKGSPKGASPELLTDFMSGELLGIPTVVVFLVLFAVGATLFQGWTVYGRQLHAVGNNPVAARFAGLRVRTLTASAYGVSALCAGFVGMMLVGYAQGATLRMGDDYLLPSIAAVVIGGSSILGGKGNFAGTVGGAILLTTLTTIISAIGLAQGWKTIIEGVIILLALLLLREELFTAVQRLVGRQNT
ncbi:ABC transporter permease [Rhodovibrio salinarum]|uniref:ABC transporter permease n=1 Tax=Rhodovibrio salinarum TaxID=1087 RepID=A0A934UYI4_9PROT|nr:ABC transporter permease [Rhodovibrio salinarum]MBK1696147.1 ABC transporter permease [Rhodovibrio salinarum]